MSIDRQGERIIARRIACVAACIAASMLTSACGGPRDDERPSIVLIVVDTLRRDAVSAYGRVEGTTPTIDALARSGLRYERAYAPSPWTLPSHASLLTGLDVDRHGVGMPGRVALPDDLATLAEALAGAGYETAAFSENLLVSDDFAMLRGFAHRSTSRIRKVPRTPGSTEKALVSVDVLDAVGRWREQRDPGRPFFVFVNLIDAHTPYTARDRNPWVPAGVAASEIERLGAVPSHLLCDALPDERDLAILHGLYLGDVHEADTKIAALLDALRDEAPDGSLITVVTSDHGELFGEGRLIGHEFSLNEGLLDVPLVVSGWPGAGPAVVSTPVSLLDLAPTVLAWAGVESSAGLDGRVLPTSEDATASRVLRAAYSDGYVSTVAGWKGMIGFESKDRVRRFCPPDEPVRGGMTAIIEYPLKYVWYEHYAPRLFDLGWDPHEMSDIASHRPEDTSRLQALAVQYAHDTALGEPDATTARGPDETRRRALKELGYIE